MKNILTTSCLGALCLLAIISARVVAQPAEVPNAQAGSLTVKRGSDGAIKLHVENKSTGVMPQNGKTGFRLEDSPEGAINIHEFGAKGDGVNLDTPAINAALAQAPKLFFPNGIYRIDARANVITNVFGARGSQRAGLIIPSNRNLLFESNACLLVSHTDSGSYNALVALDATNIYFNGGTLIGDRYDQGGRKGEFGYGLVIAGCSDVVIANFTSVSNWGDGVFLCCGALNAENRNVRLVNCKLADNRRNNLSIIAAKDTLIEGCAFLRARGTAPQSGIDIEPDMSNLMGISPEVSGVIIRDCLVQSNASSGIDLQHAPGDKKVVIRDIHISHNRIEGNGKSGIQHASTTQGGIRITDNLICDNRAQGMNVTAMRDAVIEGNVISNNCTFGIEFSSGLRCSISRNVFWDNCSAAPQRFCQLDLHNYCSENMIARNVFVAEGERSLPKHHLRIWNEGIYYCVKNSVVENSFFKSADLVKEFLDAGLRTIVSSNMFGL